MDCFETTTLVKKKKKNQLLERPYFSSKDIGMSTQIFIHGIGIITIMSGVWLSYLNLPLVFNSPYLAMFV